MEYHHGGQHKPTKMQSRVIIILLPLLLILWLGAGKAAISKSSPLANWRFSDPHYTSNQYAKILDESGLGHDPDDKDKMNVGINLNPEHLQIQYVDYQPQCQAGGVAVCATNGTDSFYFENDCRLEAHNMKMLFQYGTELEPTEMERCLPSCQTMKCTPVERPVCALAEIGGAVPQTFANECEMRQSECHTKQVLRILHQGPCHPPTKSLRKKKQRRSKKKSLKSSSKLSSQPRKVYYLMGTPPTPTPPTPPPPPAPRHTAITTSPRLINNNRRLLGRPPRITTTPRSMPTRLTSTSPSPMQFQQLRGLANPMVSVSRAVDAYNVYNIPDVGQDYGEITDSSLSLYLPGVGRVTEAYTTSRSSSTTTWGITLGTTLSPSIKSTTTTTTTTPKPLMTTTKRRVLIMVEPMATTVEPLLPSTQASMEKQSTVADLEAVTLGASTTTQESTTKIKTT
ncbi:hypothetical protein KR059_008992 [Drosophila kikkawai]|nr:hypothetical protein KR059_008992 [Drosophila kikkawai]